MERSSSNSDTYYFEHSGWIEKDANAEQVRGMLTTLSISLIMFMRNQRNMDFDWSKAKFEEHEYPLVDFDFMYRKVQVCAYIPGIDRKRFLNG